MAHLRTPTPAAPLKLWVGGDSITETFGTQLVRVSESTKLFNTTLDFHVSTGLSVPTYFNWPLHLAQDVIPKTDPDVVVIMFGANDGQNILMPDGKILTAFSPEWQTEYGKRVGAVMDLLKSPTNDRIVVWPGPPPMGPESGVHGMDLISHIDWSEARTRPWVHYVDTWVYFSDPHLQFRHYLPSAAGQLRGLRQKDDIHMSDIGGTRHVVDRAARPGPVGRPLRCAGPPRPERPAASEHQGATGHTPARAGGDLGAPASDAVGAHRLTRLREPLACADEHVRHRRVHRQLPRGLESCATRLRASAGSRSVRSPCRRPSSAASPFPSIQMTTGYSTGQRTC